MEHYNAKKSPRFDMNDFLGLRKNTKAYIVFYLHFIKCIIKKTPFDERMRAVRPGFDICTVSDEALALLLLENSWDRWMDLYTKDPTAVWPRRGGKKNNNAVVSLVRTKYTTGGYRYDKESTLNQIYTKGWSQDGIRRYNELYDLVQADRATYHVMFISALTLHRCGPNHTPSSNKHGRNQDRLVKVRHNLFGNSTVNVGEGNDDSSTKGEGTSNQYQSLNPYTAESDEEVEEYDGDGGRKEEV